MTNARRKITRRGFVAGAASAAGAAAAPYVLTSAALGAPGTPPASERIAIALVGTGNINTQHRGAFLAQKDAVIVAVCDPFADRRAAYRDLINRHYGGKVCTDWGDFRELIARADVDAVCIGTPDHWHAPQAIAAMKAGKDVYVEKPLTHTIAQGRAVVQTARAYGRILQTGLQRRSHGSCRFICELVRNGRIGRLTQVKVGIIGINAGVQVGRGFPAAPVPQGCDYDLWLGPAPVRPFCPQRVARGNETCYWYYISDYTTGFISGNGVHFVDIAQWGIGPDVAIAEVHTLWATIPADGLVDDAIAWRAEVLYANGVRMSYSSEGNPHPDGIRFEGTDGWVHVSGGGQLSAEPRSLLRTVIAPEEIHLYESPGHHRNFLDCIRTRKPTAADAEIGHHATTTCNLVEISARLGRKVKWDAAREHFFAGSAGDGAADRMLTRAMREPWRL